MNKKYIILFCVLLALWLGFSGIYNVLFIFYGILFSIFSTLIIKKMEGFSKEKFFSKKTFPNFLTLNFSKYCVWISKEICISTIKLSKEIWSIKPNIRPQLSWVKHNLKSAEQIAAYANSITLTPATISVATNKDEILVHTIHEKNITDLKSGEMENKIKKFYN